MRKIRLTVGGTPIGRAFTWSYPFSDGKIYVIPTYEMAVQGTNAEGRQASKKFEVLRFGVHRTESNPVPHLVGIAKPETDIIRRWIPTYKVHSFPSREDGAWQVRGNFLIHDGPDHPFEQLYATAGCIEVCGGPAGFVTFNRFVAEISGSNRRSLGEMLKQIGGSGCMSIVFQSAVLPPLQLRQ